MENQRKCITSSLLFLVWKTFFYLIFSVLDHPHLSAWIWILLSIHGLNFVLTQRMKQSLNYEIWKDQNSGGQDCRAHPVCLSQIRSQPSIYLCSCHQSYPTTCIFLKGTRTHTHTHWRTFFCDAAIIPTITILCVPFDTQGIVQHKHLQINTYHVYRDIWLFAVKSVYVCMSPIQIPILPLTPQVTMHNKHTKSDKCHTGTIQLITTSN